MKTGPIRITFDGKTASFESGTTILAAAESLGVRIPTLCFFRGENCKKEDSAEGTQNEAIAPVTCQVCLVRANGRIVPSCATLLIDEMEIESETPEIHSLRRTALELLLSDHAGDCFTPCQLGCPVRLEIPRILRLVAAGRDVEAARAVWDEMPFPGILGKTCSRPCEKLCRRRLLDSAISIGDLKTRLSDLLLNQKQNFGPDFFFPSRSERVAVVGAGLSGLSAAFRLAKNGISVTIFEESGLAGGKIREYGAEILPPERIDAEIDFFFASSPTGRVEFVPNRRVDWTDEAVLADLLLSSKNWDSDSGGVPLNAGASLTSFGRPDSNFVRSRITAQYDAVLVACREKKSEPARKIGRSLDAPKSVAKGLRMASRVLARFDSGEKNLGVIPRDDTSPPPIWSVRVKKPTDSELLALATVGNTPYPETDSIDSFATNRTISDTEEARRCLTCDCRGREKCRLFTESARLGAKPDRFTDAVRPAIDSLQKGDNLLYEPSKCIKCGLCIKITAHGDEHLGLAWIGRGFDVQVGLPFGRPLSEGVTQTAAACVAACPTGGLVRVDPGLDGGK